MVHDLQELFSEVKKYPAEDVFVVGGAMLYKTLLPYCEEVIVTKVDADGGAEVYFENLDQLNNWTCVSVGEPIETNGYMIRFTVYRNSDVLPY